MNDHQNTPSAAAVATELESLLTEQLALYEKLRSLANRQRHLVTQDDPQPLLALLGERQSVVDALTELTSRLVPVQRSWRQQSRHADGACRQRLDGMIDRISKTLQSVLDSDAEDARHLAARKQQAHTAIERAGEGQRALSAYQSVVTAGSSSFVATDHSI